MNWQQGIKLSPFYLTRNNEIEIQQNRTLDTMVDLMMIFVSALFDMQIRNPRFLRQFGLFSILFFCMLLFSVDTFHSLSILLSFITASKPFYYALDFFHKIQFHFSASHVLVDVTVTGLARVML